MTRLGPGDAARLWQAWHLGAWTFTLRGRRGTCGTGLALVARLGPCDAARLCVAGVLHLVTWTFTLRGKYGDYGTGMAVVTRLGPGDAARLCAHTHTSLSHTHTTL